MVIFDTNVLIELYRGNDKQEMRHIRKHIDHYTILPITREISDVFIDLFQQYSLSHKPSIPDTLIAATALHYGLPVLTLNKKDFQYFPGIALM